MQRLLVFSFFFGLFHVDGGSIGHDGGDGDDCYSLLMQLVVSAACRCCALNKSVRKHLGDGFAELTAPCLPKTDEPKCRSKGSHTHIDPPAPPEVLLVQSRGCCWVFSRGWRYSGAPGAGARRSPVMGSCCCSRDDVPRKQQKGAEVSSERVASCQLRPNRTSLHAGSQS